MTLANYITLIRLAFIPVFVGVLMMYTGESEGMRWGALALFVAIAATDGVDGWVARRWHQESELGAALDPIADKLLVNMALIFIALNPILGELLPLWYALVILTRDLIIVVGFAYLTRTVGDVRVRPRITGKLSTAFQMALIVAVLLRWQGAPWILWPALAMAIAAFAAYLRDGVHHLTRGREESPS